MRFRVSLLRKTLLLSKKEVYSPIPCQSCSSRIFYWLFASGYLLVSVLAREGWQEYTYCMNNDDVQFDIDDTQVRMTPQVETSKLVQWVKKYSFGLIKDERQANYTLFVFCVIAFSFTVFMFLG